MTVESKKWIVLNNEIMVKDSEGNFQLNKDEEAVKSFFLDNINVKLRSFLTLKEKIDFLIENKYWVNFYEHYSFKDIKRVVQKAYSFNFRFKSYMSAEKFFNSYALKDDKLDDTGKPIAILERYEDRVSCVALFLAKEDGVEKAIEYVDVMMQQEYQPATPTFLNAGKVRGGELVSCFLDEVSDDLSGHAYTVDSAMQLSKIGGGVSFDLSHIRARGEAIKGVEGRASGVMPQTKVLEDTFSYVNQLGQRTGAGAVYLNIFHADIEEFLDCKKINVDEKSRIKSLSIGVTVPSKFMELAEKDEPFYVFYPHNINKVLGKSLNDLDFDNTNIYQELIDNPLIKKKLLNARNLLVKIAQVQKESGYPYLHYKGNSNKSHALKNVGQIKFSNLCLFGGSEILLNNDGHTKTIEELAEFSQGINQFDILTSEVDEFNNESIITAKAIAYQTGFKKLVIVKFKDGSSIKVTEDHKLYTINRKKVEAKNSLGCFISSYNKPHLEVVDIAYGNVVLPVFDITVFNDSHNFFARDKGSKNFALVSNCTEVLQVSKVSNIKPRYDVSEYNYGISCILGSLNIVPVMTNKSLEKTVRTAMRMLTTVSDVTDIKQVPSISNANRDFRSVGLGAMNLHGFLAKNKIMFESEQALEFVDKFFMLVNYYSIMESMEISKERQSPFKGFELSEYASGEYFDNYLQDYSESFKFEKIQKLFNGITIPTESDWLKLKADVMKYGVYNAYRLCIAPNQSTSYIMSATASIMPIVDVIETREYGNSTTYYPMPYLNNSNFLYFKSAYDMNQNKVMRLVATAQKHIDQGISCILHTNSTDTTRDLAKYYIVAHKLGLKTLYYTRTRKSSISECISCSA